MKHSILLLVFFCASYNVLAQRDVTTSESIDKKSFNPAHVMWFTKPASKWEEALPVGNGRLGVMVYGGTKESVIHLNEDTYWSGGPYSTVHKGGHEKLKEVQQLVFEGKLLKAHNTFGRHLMGYPVEQQKYQSLGNLHLNFELKGEPSNYKRWLDLETGVTVVEYDADGKRIRQEVFVSHPDQVIVVRLTSQGGPMTFTANLRGVRNQAHSNYGTDYFEMNGFGSDGLILTGKSTDYLGVDGKLRYEARLKAVAEGGSVSVDDYVLRVSGASTATLVIAAATNFVNYKDVSADQRARVDGYLNAIAGKTYEQIRTEHLVDFSKFFSRTKLTFPNTVSSFLPTDERMASIQQTPDPQLAALVYQFGRYVLISSSRPGTQAANLQGIWNNDMNPAWDSKYTTNINTQMNYWPAESANLAEFAEPLLQLIKEVTEQGREVAREHYGAGGWVLHQNTDIWRVAAPMDGPTWGTFTTGGAWLVNELWDHYCYTKDERWLRELYPVMKGSVEFFMDFLVPHPNGKWLVTNPSTSPENFPGSPDNGRYFDEVTGSMLPGTSICAGSTIDMQILSDLFRSYAEASAILKTDQEFAARVSATRARLVPPLVGSSGALQEWADDWSQLEANHRHFSHLYGVYPGHVITPLKAPDFIDACKAVLEQRGDGGTGWSRAWKVAIWARLYDGDRANKIFKGYLKEQAYPQLFAKCFTPMQVDGTLGMTAGISELLVQSHDGFIDVLPALPSEWREGNFKGVCTRGGFEMEFDWADGKVKSISILSKAGEMCKLRVKGQLKSRTPLKMKKGAHNAMEFATKKGQRYTFDVR